MRKAFKMMAAVGLVAAMALPASAASIDYSGFLRVKGYVSDYSDSNTGTLVPVKINDRKSFSYVDQRWRGKFAVGDENVKAITFLELNEKWGDTTTGGRIGTDGTDQLRAKNVYLWFKIPDTAVDFSVGLQNVTDAYQGVFFGAADMAGVVMNAKPAENFGLRLAYFEPQKYYAASTGFTVPQADRGAAAANSTNLYVAEAKIAASKAAKVGVNLYFLQDRFNSASVAGSTSSLKLYMPGVDFAVDAGAAKISGFAFTQFGDRKFLSGAPKTKYFGYAGDLRVDANAGPAKVFVEGLYTSGRNANKLADNKDGGIRVMDDYRQGSGSSGYVRDDMVILTPEADAIGTGRNLAYSQNNLGRGELLVTAGASADVTPKMTAKLGLGYMQAAQTEGAVAGLARKGKGMGTEVNARLTYNVTKGLDSSLTAAYVFAGDYYKVKNLTTGTTADLNGFDGKPTNPYALIAKLNYAY